uniref:ATP synthase complex subunit 8 n=1 Tax=Cyphonistes vallatus TaxID=1205660 RepID=A0A0S2MN84_9SCAR|nr:ATP synthase F0 subunit 8 [Cyphonistes vallatus]
MPQMAPLNWLFLFFMFISVFLMFNVINYFSFLYPPKKVSKEKSTTKISWKW